MTRGESDNDAPPLQLTFTSDESTPLANVAVQVTTVSSPLTNLPSDCIILTIDGGTEGKKCKIENQLYSSKKTSHCTLRL